MIISSTLVMKTSDSSSFLTTLECSDILQPTPVFSLMGTAAHLLFCGGLVLQRPTFLEQNSDVGSILQPFQGVNYNLKGIFLLVK